MKKILIAVVALLMLGSFATVQAGGVNVKVGGNAIFDPTNYGGGVAIDFSLGEDKPYGASVGVDFYKKSGITSIMVPVVAMYKAPAGEKADVYFGAGSGIYRVSNGGSSTKAMATGVAGLNFKASDAVGIFAEVKYYRAFVSGAQNKIGAAAGISFSLGGE